VIHQKLTINKNKVIHITKIFNYLTPWLNVNRDSFVDRKMWTQTLNDGSVVVCGETEVHCWYVVCCNCSSYQH